jgi:simple sugar transport system permease protein
VIVIIALIGAIFVALMLKGTHFGLRLKAIGKNDRSAHLLGIPTTRYFLLAFGICGIFAGVAGSVLVTSKQFSLIPDAGFGYGFWDCWLPCGKLSSNFIFHCGILLCCT